MCHEKNKTSLITLKILPSMHLAGSLQISEMKYWYNVNRGKICRKILSHLVINGIEGSITEMCITIIYHKYIDNKAVLLSLPHARMSPLFPLCCMKDEDFTKFFSWLNATPNYLALLHGIYKMQCKVSPKLQVCILFCFVFRYCWWVNLLGRYWYKGFLELSAFWCHSCFHRSNKMMECCEL